MDVSIAQAQMFFLALTRILAIVIHIPVLGGRTIPNSVKVGLGLLLTIVVTPWQLLPPEAPSLTSFAFGNAIARELLIGTLAGFAAVLTFSVLQIAGSLMELGSGFAASRILNPVFDVSSSALQQIFGMTGLLLFLVVNGHLAFLLGLHKTFEVVPLNSPLPVFSSDRLIALTVGLIAAGIQMALPVIGTLMMINIALGLLARVAPKVQVFFLGLPLKIGGSLLMLMLTFAILVPKLADLFHALGPRLLELLGA